jgi:flagellar biosynthesis protein FliQ
MHETDVGALLREGMIVALKVGGPPLLVALVVGLVMALVQAVTQINEQTLTFLPKVVGIAVTLVVFGTFMNASLVAYMLMLFDRMVAVGGQ